MQLSPMMFAAIFFGTSTAAQLEKLLKQPLKCNASAAWVHRDRERETETDTERQRELQRQVK